VEILRGIVWTSVRQKKTKGRESQNYADKKEHRWKWYVAVRMEGTYVDKQIESTLVYTDGGQDVCRGRFEIKDRRYFAVGDNLRVYRKGSATKSVQ
jgi:hypothetical protein